jgi:hypothetical protein
LSSSIIVIFIAFYFFTAVLPFLIVILFKILLSFNFLAEVSPLGYVQPFDLFESFVFTVETSAPYSSNTSSHCFIYPLEAKLLACSLSSPVACTLGIGSAPTPTLNTLGLHPDSCHTGLPLLMCSEGDETAFTLFNRMSPYHRSHYRPNSVLSISDRHSNRLGFLRLDKALLEHYICVEDENYIGDTSLSRRALLSQTKQSFLTLQAQTPYNTNVATLFRFMVHDNFTSRLPHPGGRPSYFLMGHTSEISSLLKQYFSLVSNYDTDIVRRSLLQDYVGKGVVCKADDLLLIQRTLRLFSGIGLHLGPSLATDNIRTLTEITILSKTSILLSAQDVEAVGNIYLIVSFCLSVKGSFLL